MKIDSVTQSYWQVSMSKWRVIQKRFYWFQQLNENMVVVYFEEKIKIKFVETLHNNNVLVWHFPLLLWISEIDFANILNVFQKIFRFLLHIHNIKPFNLTFHSFFSGYEKICVNLIKFASYRSMYVH